MLSVILILLLLSVLVIVHELGHFLLAKKEGVKVEEFGFGFPPKIISKKIGETVYSFNLIPFGGFVRLYGEDGGKKTKTSFSSKSVWSRIKIVVAGVVFNYIFAGILFLIIPFFGYLSVKPDTLPNHSTFKELGIMVLDVEQNSPAYNSGIKLSDVILKIDSQNFQDTQDIITYLKANPGKIVNVELKRKGQILNIQVETRATLKENQGPTGMLIAQTGILKYAFPYGFYEGGRNFLKTTGAIFTGFYELVKSLLFERKLIAQVTGPIGIFDLGINFFSFGFSSLLHFIAILSLNLAILNIIPFPALDGGRLLFILIEGFTRKKVNEKYEIVFHKIGFILLILLLLSVTFKDLETHFTNFTHFITNIL